MGAFHQTRLSFMRALMRRIKREAWGFERTHWQIDARGVGVGVYRVKTPDHAYSLICFAHDLPADQRSDRVIAQAWDATFTLFDGEPSADDIARLADNVPKQEAGRVSEHELVLSRANRSVRLFDHVVDCLSAGCQPARDEIEAVGYLMRTTAVYGNGKFGLADRERLVDREALSGPFRLEMLSVYLIRAFTCDLVEHLAQMRAPDRAVPLAPALRRRLGVGNSTGLGMAPFLVTHPHLLDRWIAAREEGLARVRALPKAYDQSRMTFREMLTRARLGADQWLSADPRQQARTQGLRADLALLADHISGAVLEGDFPWDALMRWGEGALSLEGQEQLVSLMLEPHGELIDDLTRTMSADEEASFRIDGALACGAFRAQLRERYGWALDVDYAAQAAQAHFWYVSEEKLEPRLGSRDQEPGAEREQPLAVGRDVAALDARLGEYDADFGLAQFLIENPDHRHAVRRVQIAATHPYSEIRDNLIAQEMLPIDLLRCKLSFFGATRFDPRSDRWVRITMFQDAPFPHEIDTMPADDWAYPPLI
jgi:hypothetical protein